MTECSSDWTVRFPNLAGVDGPAEFRPISLDFQWNRTEFAYAKAKFPTEVGDMLKPHTRFSLGGLRDEMLVHLCFEGDPIYLLYFEPDFIEYGTRYTHLELQDLQKSMDSGLVDKQWETVKLGNAYRHVFEQSEDDVIEQMRFTVPENLELIGQDATEDVLLAGFSLFSNLSGIDEGEIEAKKTQRLMQTDYAIDLEKVTPFKALFTLNEKFGVRSWVDMDQTLWIGYPETRQQTHLAAPDDPRVWRYSPEEVNIRHLRRPVKQVTIEGGWMDEPGIGGVEDAVGEVQSWFTSNERGAGDYRVHGIAYRTDIDYGERLAYENHNIKRNAIADVAEARMREVMKQGYSGQVEITPDLSGNSTALHAVQPGDFIHLVPSDHGFDDPNARSGRIGDKPEPMDDCQGFVNNELYLITEVQQHVDDNGYWSTTLDVTLYPTVLDEPNKANPDINNMESVVRLYDPSADEFLDIENIDEGDWLEDDWKSIAFNHTNADI